MFDTTEQHEAYRAGEEPLSGIVLTTMESLSEIRRIWKRIKKLRARLHGVSDTLTGAEITEEGAVRVPDSLICTCKCLTDWDVHELPHYIESTSTLLACIDKRDGSSRRPSFVKWIEMTRQKKAKFWGLGIRTTSETASFDHQATIKMMASMRWLVKSPEIGGSGMDLAAIWREFIEETGGQAAARGIATTVAPTSQPAALVPAWTSDFSPSTGPSTAQEPGRILWGPESGSHGLWGPWRVPEAPW